MQIVRTSLCAALLWLGASKSARAVGIERSEPTVTVLPAATGVTAEAQTIIDASPGRVAAVAGDPASFGELLPAAVVRLRGSADGAQIVEVERQEPWPVGVVRWVESVRRREAAGGTIVVERQALDVASGYFKRLQATWWIAPLPGGRSAVTYRVSMDLRRWAPMWMLRRGNTAGLIGTLARLRRMTEGVPTPSGPLRPLAAARPAP